jgi:hypothetical protein
MVVLELLAHSRTSKGCISHTTIFKYFANFSDFRKARSCGALKMNSCSPNAPRHPASSIRYVQCQRLSLSQYISLGMRKENNDVKPRVLYAAIAGPPSAEWEARRAQAAAVRLRLCS